MKESHGWKHDELMHDLAGYLRSPDRMVWEDMQLGPSGSPRPDVFTLQKSYSKPVPTAFECKVSRSDLRSDTTSGKWQSYLKYAGSVTFAVPDGLCTVADIPDGCGLIVRKAEVWRYARRPTIQRVQMPFDAVMKLLIDGVERASRNHLPQPRSITLWAENAAVRKRFGEAVEKAARDLTVAQNSVANHKDTARYLREQAEQQAKASADFILRQVREEAATHEATKRELCEWLDIPPETSAYEVRRRIAAMKASCSADQRVAAVESRLQVARRAIESAAHAIADETRGIAA